MLIQTRMPKTRCRKGTVQKHQTRKKTAPNIFGWKLVGHCDFIVLSRLGFFKCFHYLKNIKLFGGQNQIIKYNAFVLEKKSMICIASWSSLKCHAFLIQTRTMPRACWINLCMYFVFKVHPLMIAYISRRVYSFKS